MELWPEETAAEEIDVSAKTLARWRKAGTGPPYVPLGRKVRYRPEDVHAWLVDQVRRPGLRAVS